MLKKKKLDEPLAKLQFSGIKEFYRAVGFGNAAVNDLLKVMHPRKFAEGAEKSKRIKNIMNRISKDEYKDAVLVKRYDNILIKFGKCCNPVPGEQIIGFITRGRGITVHVYNCPKLLEVAPERRIEVAWNEEYSGRIPIGLSVRCENRKRDSLRTHEYGFGSEC